MRSSKQLALPVVLFLAVCACLPVGNARGQSVQNLKIAFEGNHITATYDLIFTDETNPFEVKFFSSFDGYKAPLEFVSGDAGPNVYPGRNKRATWLVASTLPGNFDGDVTLKVKAARVVKANTLSFTPLSKTTYKKGQTVDIQWNGGASNSKVNIDLLKDGVVQLSVVQNVDNKKSYGWKIPKGYKGSGYTLSVSAGTEKTQSPLFNIKSGVNPWLIAVPVVVVGGTAVALAGGGSKENPTAGDDMLPGPITPQ